MKFYKFKVYIVIWYIKRSCKIIWFGNRCIIHSKSSKGFWVAWPRIHSFSSNDTTSAFYNLFLQIWKVFFFFSFLKYIFEFSIFFCLITTLVVNIIYNMFLNVWFCNYHYKKLYFFLTKKIVEKAFSNAFLTVNKVVGDTSSEKSYPNAKKFLCQENLILRRLELREDLQTPKGWHQ